MKAPIRGDQRCDERLEGGGFKVNKGKKLARTRKKKVLGGKGSAFQHLYFLSNTKGNREAVGRQDEKKWGRLSVDQGHC